MLRMLPLALCGVLCLTSPAWAEGLQVWEASLGAPGVTASFGAGAGQQADLDLDAGSAEGGGLQLGATEIELQPSGSVVFVDFACSVPGCLVAFTPGGADEGAGLRMTDPDPQTSSGVLDLGTLTFDAGAPDGGIHLVDCHYVGQDTEERQCGSFQLVTLPEPAGPATLLVGAGLLFGLLRRRS